MFSSDSWAATAEAAAVEFQLNTEKLVGNKKCDDISGHAEAHLHLQPVQSHRRLA